MQGLEGRQGQGGVSGQSNIVARDRKLRTTQTPFTTQKIMNHDHVQQLLASQRLRHRGNEGNVVKDWCLKE